MNRSLTRKQLLERAALGGAALTLPGFLAACGGGEGETAATGATTAAGGSKKLADTLRFSNWQLYIDVDEKTKKRPTLAQFTKETGVKVSYFEDINDNATYFGKIQRPLAQGQSIDRDIIVLTDNSRFPSLLIDKGWAEPLDKDAIPNIKNLQDSLASPSFDPDRE
jgi:spermidine/putrescine transport system substrate-binding protein